MKYTNILVIQTAFIGDAILASSLLEKLHHQFPQAQLSLLVRSGNEGLYRDHPFLHELLVWNKKSGKLVNLFKMALNIRKKKFDCIINCHRFASSGFLTALSGSKHIAGFKQNPFSFMFNFSVKHRFEGGLHEIDRYHELLSDFCDDQKFKPKLYPSSKDAEHIQPYCRPPFVCIAPASVWYTKQVPANKWVELCRLIPGHITIYLLGAGSDKVLCDQIIHSSGRSNIQELCGKLDLLQSALLMSKADMNFVNDSAPLHLASAMNAPVRAFFLSTVPDFGFGPLSENSKVIEVKDLACRPCGIHGYRNCPKKHFKCATHLPISEALA